jgi:hypothetical protein
VPAGSRPLAGRDLLTGLAPTPSQPAPAVAPATPLLRRFEDLLPAGQLETLYAVLALGTLGLFLAWRAGVLVRHRPISGGRRS